MTHTGRPLVSVGMPAFNSERTIRESIECILCQDLRDLELIISDNASTDGTWAIVQEFAGRDPRVVAVRQERNVGANGNYSAVFRSARGPFFKWASSNDWCEPGFLSRCVRALDAHPEAVLVAPRTKLFEHSFASGIDYDGDMSFDADDPVRRFADVTSRLRLNNVFNGVIRSDALRRTRLVEHYRGADVVLIGHLALLGKIMLLDDRLFGRCMAREVATAMMSNEGIERHHYPHRTWRALFPGLRQATGCLQAVMASDLRKRDRLRALAWVARLLRWRGPQLRDELRDAMRYTLQ